MAEGSSGNSPEVPHIKITPVEQKKKKGLRLNLSVEPQTPVTVPPAEISQSVTTASSEIVNTEQRRFSGVNFAELQRRREQFVSELEAKYRRGEEPRIGNVGLVLESDKTWESQLSQVARDERLLTCQIVSFQNALRSLGVYNPETDSQEQLVREVRDLFSEGGSDITALDRLTSNRASRGMQINIVNFQQAIEQLLDGKVAVHGNAGHMVFISRIEARKNPQTQEIEIGVRKIDPLAQVVHSKFVPLHELARETPTYRAFSLAQPSRLRLSPRQ